ncbi:MAG TPA: DUF1987 domain-containing protein [Bacteroidia bacterium]|nr:DUF1987 domain-containing protein [Bacteroidia bacterium]HRD40191.1 DUF1987 domain-containing protein [Bacteroidia bacterium]
MNNITIEGTKRTPNVEFNTNGNLLISGTSISENAVAFYHPLINWVKEFVQTQPAKITLNINLDYINTSSNTCLLKMLSEIKSGISLAEQLTIIWNFDKEDEDAQEHGEIIQKLIKHPLKFIPVDYENN